MTPDNATTSAEWWTEPDFDAHKVLASVAEYIRDAQQWQLDADQLHAEMYAGPRARMYSDHPSTSTFLYEPTRLARNLSRSMVDTYVAKIGKHRPLPEILASKGSWRDQRRAKKMTQLVEGEFDRHKVFKKWARLIIRDAGIASRGGHLKIDLRTLDSKSITCERIHWRELFYDEADAQHGDPRNAYLIRTADQGVLTKAFASGKKKDDEELATAIEEAGKSDSSGWDMLTGSGMHSTVGRVRVFEAWHLCDDVEAHEEDRDHECNGRHVVAIRGKTLVDEDWPFDRFPFVSLFYLQPLEGMTSPSLCERLEGWHYEQNLMSEKISDSHYYSGGGIIWVQNGPDLVEEDFTNSVWKVMRGAPGAEPKFINPEPMHPAGYAYLRDIQYDALGEEGFSAMSARSEKPAGVTAAVALETLDDQETERFGMQGYDYAQWCVDVAELFLMWIQHIVKKHDDYSSRVPIRGGILELSYKDVSVDSYIVQAHSSALMRMTPAARKQMAQDLFNAGRIDGLTFLRYIGDGAEDIEAEIDTQTADRLKSDEQIESMLDADDPNDPDSYLPPSPYSTELAWTLHRAQLRVAQAEMAGCPEENLQLVREYILECDALMQQQSGAVSPQAQMTPAGPGPTGLMAPPGALPPLPVAGPGSTPGAPPGPPPTIQ